MDDRQRKGERETMTHAGGVVVRRSEEETEVLLVRASRAPHDWVLPKGHVESGEIPAATARREIQEEAGVDAAPGQFLGIVRFETPGGRRVAAGFFLMAYVGDVESDEEREVMWCPFDRAIDAVQYENVREILRSAKSLSL